MQETCEEARQSLEVSGNFSSEFSTCFPHLWNFQFFPYSSRFLYFSTNLMMRI